LENLKEPKQLLVPLNIRDGSLIFPAILCDVIKAPVAYSIS